MYWSHFPRDIQREILLRLPYDDVMCLCQDDAFAWINQDADYWSKRANVKQWVFSVSFDAYPEVYLRLRYGAKVKALLNDESLGFVGWIRWSNALTKVLTDGNLSRDVRYEFAIYMFSQAEDWKERVSNCMRTIVKHPKILKWIANTGATIDASTRGMICKTYKHGGIVAVHDLESITEIDWDDALKFEVYKHLELLRYIVVNKKYKRETLNDTYMIAAENGHEDIAMYLESMVDDVYRRIYCTKY